MNPKLRPIKTTLHNVSGFSGLGHMFHYIAAKMTKVNIRTSSNEYPSSQWFPTRGTGTL